MATIRVLPESIANKIAAGEVVERPASIVKELVENALDAGARSIDLVIQHGGKSMIRVADDGCGMDREDARLAFERHATSKVTTLADLEKIESFGFRGEALPSIAAVSRTRLISRPERSDTGTEVVVEAGNLLGVQEHPCRKGTVVEVRDLFFNTPARRKFLRSESTEMGGILEVVSHLALCALGVRFTFRSGEKIVLDLLPAEELSQRAEAILGKESAGELLPLDQEQDGVHLWGLIGKPSFTRANRTGQHFFVNRRWVRSQPISYALFAGHHGLLMERRYPVAVLFLDLDLSRVDVNVHPAKLEVRISNEAQVTTFLKETVKACFTRAGNLAPQMPAPRAASSIPARSYRLETDPAAARTWGVVFDRMIAPKISSTAEIPLNESESISFRDSVRVTKILGTIRNTFLLAETEEGFLIVDQHAAHERIQFETLLKGFESGRAERQTLLLEEVLELHPKQRDLFAEALSFLTRVGFEIEPFGEDSFVIRAYPAVFGEINVVGLLKTFLQEQEEGKLRSALEDAKDAVAALCACKKQSVKAGDPLVPAAIRALLARLAQCENPFTCPHGRPVFISQSFSDLERQFKRT